MPQSPVCLKISFREGSNVSAAEGGGGGAELLSDLSGAHGMNNEWHRALRPCVLRGPRSPGLQGASGIFPEKAHCPPNAQGLYWKGGGTPLQGRPAHAQLPSP